jgi:hypothetical protein
MDPNAAIRYISLIYELHKKTPTIDTVFLNILKQFAWQKPLSAYQLWRNLRSTDSGMAYKNINKRVRGLLSLNLIQEIKTSGNNINKHNAKYYELTEFGIYQLFLNKPNALHIRELDTIKSANPPSSNTLIFFHNYHNSLLFESFLYPYFGKNTFFAMGDYLLWDLYTYLANCCHKIKQELEYYDYNIPIYDTAFYWNKVQKHDKNLLLHLKEQFNLESIDSCEIQKINDNNDTIFVKTSAAPIIIKYDKYREKVIAISRVEGKHREIEYNTTKLGPDILVGMHLPNEKLLQDIIIDTKRQIQQIIYEFVYDLSLAELDRDKAREFFYYCKVLSQDKRFMEVVEDIYKNRHVAFEKGYQMLTTNAA